MSGPVNPNSPYPPQPPQYSPQTQYPPQYPPQQPPYGQPYRGFPPGSPVNSGPQKPVSIVIFGIFHLVVALFSLGWVIWLSAMLAIGMNNERVNDAMNRNSDIMLLIYEQTGYVQYQIFIIVLGGLLTLVLFAAGILLLMGKEKGRDLSVSYSIGSIVLNVLSMAFQIFTGIMLLSSIDAPRRVSEPAGMMVLVGAVMLFFCLIYPALTLLFMTRKPVKDYLNQK